MLLIAAPATLALPGRPMLPIGPEDRAMLRSLPARMIIAACLCLAFAVPAHAAEPKRVALVIGVGAYRNAPAFDDRGAAWWTMSWASAPVPAAPRPPCAP